MATKLDIDIRKWAVEQTLDVYRGTAELQKIETLIAKAHQLEQFVNLGIAKLEDKRNTDR